MPIYEYRCLECAEVTELIQKFGARPLRKCPSCSGKVEKLVSRSAFLLKGGGWFSEGYGAKEKKPKKKAKPAKGDGAATGGASSEPKPKKKASGASS